MAIEKVGVYPKWLTPKQKTDDKRNPAPELLLGKRCHWIARWYDTENKRYGKVFKTIREAQRVCVEVGEAAKSSSGSQTNKDYP